MGSTLRLGILCCVAFVLLGPATNAQGDDTCFDPVQWAFPQEPSRVAPSDLPPQFIKEAGGEFAMFAGGVHDERPPIPGVSWAEASQLSSERDLLYLFRLGDLDLVFFYSEKCGLEKDYSHSCIPAVWNGEEIVVSSLPHDYPHLFVRQKEQGRLRWTRFVWDPERRKYQSDCEASEVETRSADDSELELSPSTLLGAAQQALREDPRLGIASRALNRASRRTLEYGYGSGSPVLVVDRENQSTATVYYGPPFSEGYFLEFRRAEGAVWELIDVVSPP